jgi:hypothetical protein
VWIPPEKGEKKGKSEGLVLQFSLGPKKGSEFIIKWTSQWGAPQLKTPG